jgi:hypothetical protein
LEFFLKVFFGVFQVCFRIFSSIRFKSSFRALGFSFRVFQGFLLGFIFGNFLGVSFNICFKGYFEIVFRLSFRVCLNVPLGLFLRFVLRTLGGLF